MVNSYQVCECVCVFRKEAEIEGLSVKGGSRKDRRHLAVANYKSCNDRKTRIAHTLTCLCFRVRSCQMKTVVNRKITMLHIGRAGEFLRTML